MKLRPSWRSKEVIQHTDWKKYQLRVTPAFAEPRGCKPIAQIVVLLILTSGYMYSVHNHHIHRQCHHHHHRQCHQHDQLQCFNHQSAQVFLHLDSWTTRQPGSSLALNDGETEQQRRRRRGKYNSCGHVFILADNLTLRWLIIHGWDQPSENKDRFKWFDNYKIEV